MTIFAARFRFSYDPSSEKLCSFKKEKGKKKEEEGKKGKKERKKL